MSKSKSKILKHYSFLCAGEYREYIHIIVYDMRQVKAAVKKYYGPRFLDFLPGGSHFSVSDCGISHVNLNGQIII